MIKHGQLENGVKDIFRLKVVSGNFAGIYDIKKPVGFDEIDCIVDIDKEFYNINNIIIGETDKIKISQYYDPKTFDLINNVYEEQGGDGRIIFYWQKQKGNEIIDLLDENYALNLNKYKIKYSQSRKQIETEIKKRDEQNLLLTREETSVNLFATSDLDENIITPIQTTDILYKEGGREFKNFYFLTASIFGRIMWINRNSFMFTFIRSDSFEFGTNTNNESGYINYTVNESGYINYTVRILGYNGPLLSNIAPLNNLQVEISNMIVESPIVTSGDGVGTKPFKLFAIKRQGGSEYARILIESSTMDDSSQCYTINVLNKKYDLGSTLENTSIDLLFVFDNGEEAGFKVVDENVTIELITKTILPIRKSKSVLLKDAITQLCKQYTSGEIVLQSATIDNGGKFEKTAVSSGLFLRGVANVFLGQEKFTTSLKTLFQDCASPLMALGYDLDAKNLIIEDINYFYKDLQAYDFSDKDFVQDSYIIENDSEIIYNNLIFGTSKFSTENKDDIKNFNTKMEVSTPIKSLKNKLDKTAGCIIDENKIQELILDTTSATNNSDDDVIFIDLVNIETFADEGVLVRCSHEISNGYLWLTCYETPFDTLPLSVGMTINITGGLNLGSYEILEINKARLKLNKTSGIQEGVSDTIINFTLTNIIKNRTNEGFSNITNVENPKSCSNVRHNPKYQMARWFPLFGGGLINKLDNENLIISDYKNNGNVSIEWDSVDLDNEISGLTTLNAKESLGRLRTHRTPFFNGKKIEITLTKVTLDEFFTFLNNWRKGKGNDRMTSRGFVTIKVEGKLMNIYPFGDGGINFDMKSNQLKFKGKVKNIYYNNDPFRYFDRFHAYEFE